MKKFFFACFIGINCWGATLGVPDLQTSSSAATHSFINPDSTTSIDGTTETIIKQQISNFSAQIKGKIIQSKHFQVIDIDNKLAYTYNSTTSSNNTKSLNESNILPGNKPSSLPDYILIGTVSAIDAGEETHQISDTNRYSLIYSIDIAVDYKLIRTRDSVIVSSFTAAGHGGDVKLTTNQQQKMNHNIPKLVKETGADLANDVNNQLTIQLENGKIIRDYQEATPKTVKLTTYNSSES